MESDIASAMKHRDTCPKCSSTDIISDAKVIDRVNAAEMDLTIATYGKPEALLFKDQRVSTVSAWVCGSCGFIELYADAPRDIRIQG